MNADDLDNLYGILREAEKYEAWEDRQVPVSKCTLDNEIGATMRQILHLAEKAPIGDVLQSVNFLWAMDAEGTVSLAVEEVAMIGDTHVRKGLPVRRGVDARVSNDKKLGHPCVTIDGKARIAGEIYVDESTEKPGQLAWTLNAKSGRFHRTIDRRPSNTQVRNVAQIFATAIGEPISLDLIDDMRMGSNELKPGAGK